MRPGQEARCSTEPQAPSGSLEEGPFPLTGFLRLSLEILGEEVLG